MNDPLKLLRHSSSSSEEIVDKENSMNQLIEKVESKASEDASD